MLKNNCFAFKKYLWYVLRVQLSNKSSASILMNEEISNLFNQNLPCYKTIIAGYSNALHPQCTNVAKFLYQKVFSMLRQHGIDYFCFAGALVGYVRNKSLPPWLDDMDIMIFEKDFDAFESKLVPAFRACGFECSPKLMLKGDGQKAGYQLRGLFSRSGKRANNQIIQYDVDCPVEVPRFQVDFFFSKVVDSVVQNINGWGLYHKKKIKSCWVFPGQSIVMDGIEMTSFVDIDSDVRHEYGDVIGNVVVQSHTNILSKFSVASYDSFDHLYRRFIQGMEVLYPLGLEMHDFDSWVPNESRCVRFEAESFVVMVKSILDSLAAKVELSQDALLWAKDLKILFPGLHICAVLSSRYDVQRAVLLSDSVDSIEAVALRHRKQHFALKAEFSRL